MSPIMTWVQRLWWTLGYELPSYKYPEFVITAVTSGPSYEITDKPYCHCVGYCGDNFPCPNLKGKH